MNFESHFEMEGGLTVSTRSVVCSIRTAKLCCTIVFLMVHQEIMRGKTSLTSLTLCYHLTNWRRRWVRNRCLFSRTLQRYKFWAANFHYSLIGNHLRREVSLSAQNPTESPRNRKSLKSVTIKYPSVTSNTQYPQIENYHVLSVQECTALKTED